MCSARPICQQLSTYTLWGKLAEILFLFGKLMKVPLCASCSRYSVSANTVNQQVKDRKSFLFLCLSHFFSHMSPPSNTDPAEQSPGRDGCFKTPTANSEYLCLGKLQTQQSLRLCSSTFALTRRCNHIIVSVAAFYGRHIFIFCSNWFWQKPVIWP